jgi:serine/threonine-protein kinase
MGAPEVEGYEVVRELARGGMGVVHEAIERATGRRVALKQALPGALDAEGLRRVEVEARAAARLRHPGIVAVHALLPSPRGPVLVLDLVEGGSLQRRLDREGPLAPEEVVALGRELADALAYAHEQGVLHRDLKPANVLLGPDGRARLTDFGLAKLVAQAGSLASLTMTGDLLGTPTYMAPEQANGQPVDARTDVYGLGALLFAALTGRAPFEGASPFAVLEAVLTRPPPRPSSLRPGVPPGLEDVILACLAKDPARRPPDMRAVAARLARAPAGRGPTRGRAVGAALGLVALVGAAWIERTWATRSPAEAPAPPNARRPLRPVPPVRAATDPTPSPPPPAPVPTRPPPTPDELDSLQPGLINPGALSLADLDWLLAIRKENALARLRRLEAIAEAPGAGRDEDALADAAFLLQVNQYPQEARRDRAVVLRRLGRRGEAARDLAQVLADEPDDHDALLLRARWRLDDREVEAATADLDRVLALHPDDSTALLLRAWARGPEHLNEALTDLETLLQHVDEAGARTLGVAAARTQLIEVAPLAAVRQAQHTRKSDTELLVRHLRLLRTSVDLESGLVIEAETLVRSASYAEVPREVSRELGLLHLLAGDAPGALAELEPVAAALPEDIEVRCLVADLLHRAGRGAEAVHLLEESREVARQPGLEVVYLIQLANAFEALGRLEDALAIWRDLAAQGRPEAPAQIQRLEAKLGRR